MLNVKQSRNVTRFTQRRAGNTIYAAIVDHSEHTASNPFQVIVTRYRNHQDHSKRVASHVHAFPCRRHALAWIAGYMSLPVCV